MKRIKKIIYLLMLLVGVISCKDVFETNITNKSVVINTPNEGAKSVIYKQLFWWNQLDGATQYSIQIATPSFDSVISIVCDTVVVGVNKFYKTLSPGQYQWRIRAENGSYKTNYQTYDLTMLLSPLDQQEVNLLAPSSNTYVGATSNGVVNFSWENIPGATKYDIEIDTVTGNFGSNVTLNDITSNNFYTYTFSQDGDYKWRIMAEDDDGNKTGWSPPFYTGYYSTAPSAPVLVSPLHNSTVSATNVNFTWNAVARAKNYILYIYHDNEDTMAVSNETYSVTAPNVNKSISISSVVSGDFVHWRVATVDKAGNISARSYRRTIIIE